VGLIWRLSRGFLRFIDDLFGIVGRPCWELIVLHEVALTP
jgi:hypothetical protein